MSIEGQGHFFTIYFPGFFFVLCFTWPRYQVSVYRTIGPLVPICDLVHEMETIVHLSYVLTASGNLKNE